MNSLVLNLMLIHSAVVKLFHVYRWQDKVALLGTAQGCKCTETNHNSVKVTTEINILNKGKRLPHSMPQRRVTVLLYSFSNSALDESW